MDKKIQRCKCDHCYSSWHHRSCIIVHIAITMEEACLLFCQTETIFASYKTHSFLLPLLFSYFSNTKNWSVSSNMPVPVSWLWMNACLHNIIVYRVCIPVLYSEDHGLKSQPWNQLSLLVFFMVFLHSSRKFQVNTTN